jgi:hypothetical protein
MASLMETAFNILYLLTIWVLVAFMAKRRRDATPENSGMADRFLLAFFLLTFGDSFHVGFRVLGQIIGFDAAYIEIGGIRSSLLGLGMLATAYTMTGFYMVLADARRLRSGTKTDPAFWIMEGILALRLIIMALPGNAWESSVPPFGMGLARNIPLTIAGVLMAILIIREGRKSGDAAWMGIGWSMVASYAFYAPVILFAARLPLLGLLMIPKTVAYIVIAVIAYRRYFAPKR